MLVFEARLVRALSVLVVALRAELAADDGEAVADLMPGFSEEAAARAAATRDAAVEVGLLAAEEAAVLVVKRLLSDRPAVPFVVCFVDEPVAVGCLAAVVLEAMAVVRRLATLVERGTAEDDGAVGFVADNLDEGLLLVATVDFAAVEVAGLAVAALLAVGLLPILPMVVLARRLVAVGFVPTPVVVGLAEATDLLDAVDVGAKRLDTLETVAGFKVVDKADVVPAVRAVAVGFADAAVVVSLLCTLLARVDFVAAAAVGFDLAVMDAILLVITLAPTAPTAAAAATLAALLATLDPADFLAEVLPAEDLSSFLATSWVGSDTAVSDSVATVSVTVMSFGTASVAGGRVISVKTTSEADSMVASVF